MLAMCSPALPCPALPLMIILPLGLPTVLHFLFWHVLHMFGRAFAHICQVAMLLQHGCTTGGMDPRTALHVTLLHTCMYEDEQGSGALLLPVRRCLSIVWWCR